MECQIECPSCKAVLELTARVIRCAPLKEPRRSAEGRWNLTQREVEIANRVADGMSNKEIAQELNISLQVVKNHVRCIYDKAGCSRRTELVGMIFVGTGAMRRG